MELISSSIHTSTVQKPNKTTNIDKTNKKTNKTTIIQCLLINVTEKRGFWKTFSFTLNSTGNAY